MNKIIIRTDEDCKIGLLPAIRVSKGQRRFKFESSAVLQEFIINELGGTAIVSDIPFVNCIPVDVDLGSCVSSLYLTNKQYIGLACNEGLKKLGLFKKVLYFKKG